MLEVLGRYRDKLRQYGLGPLATSTLLVIVWSVAVWMLGFGLRTYVANEELSYNYTQARQRVGLAQDQMRGTDYRMAHPDEYREAVKLLQRPQLRRAFFDTWSRSHLCGGTSCLTLVFGEFDLVTFTVGCMLVAVFFSVIAQFAINAMLGVASLRHIGFGPVVPEIPQNRRTPSKASHIGAVVDYT